MKESFNGRVISTSDARALPIHEGKGANYPFYKEDFLDIPIDVTIIRLKPTHTQIWRSYPKLEEAIVPIYGAINVFVMDEDGRARKEELVSEFEFDPEKQDITEVYGYSNGNIILRLVHKETGKTKKLRILYENGFLINPSVTHTFQNYSDTGEDAVFLTIRKPTNEDLKKDPKLFDPDIKLS